MSNICYHPFFIRHIIQFELIFIVDCTENKIIKINALLFEEK